MTNSYINDPHQRKLLKKWSPILESGKKITSEATKIMLAQVLENTRNYYRQHGMLNEAGIARDGVLGQGRIGDKGSQGVMQGANAYPYTQYDPNNGTGYGGYGDYYLPNVVMPMLRRIMPELIANDLVGVQPLNGPVGYALAYRPLYGQDGQVGVGNLTSDAEIGYSPTDTRWSGAGLTSDVAPSSEYADSSSTSDAWKAYAGADNGGRWGGTGQDTATAEYARLG